MNRKKVLDGLGRAGSSFRNIIYTQKFSGRKKISVNILSFLISQEYF